MSLFTGLSAFPLIPLQDDAVDEASFIDLVQRLATAGVDSITALGSTGSYAYLSPDERGRVARLTVDQAGDTPVIVGVGALRTSDVLAHVAGFEYGLPLPEPRIDPHSSRRRRLYSHAEARGRLIDPRPRWSQACGKQPKFDMRTGPTSWFTLWTHGQH